MKPNRTFIIRHKETKEIWRAPSGKTSWKAINHAKSAFATSTPWRKKVYFKDQDEYEVVELKSEVEDSLSKAIHLLNDLKDELLERGIISLVEEIEEFLYECK